MSEEEPVSGYEIMPYKEVVALRKELENLKQKSVEAPSKELLDSMHELTQGIGSMLQLFRTAAEEMKMEEHEESSLSKKIHPMKEKIDQIYEHNKTIAEGLVSISDTMQDKFDHLESQIKEIHKKIEMMPEPPAVRKAAPMGPPTQPIMAPPMQGPPMAPPRPPQSPPMAPPKAPMPPSMPSPGPLPTAPQKRKGLFG